MRKKIDTRNKHYNMVGIKTICVLPEGVKGCWTSHCECDACTPGVVAAIERVSHDGLVEMARESVGKIKELQAITKEFESIRTYFDSCEAEQRLQDATKKAASLTDAMYLANSTVFVNLRFNQLAGLGLYE